MKALLISGSSRSASHTRCLVGCVAMALAPRFDSTCIWDLTSDVLPRADPAFHANPLSHSDPVVREFAGAARDADALVLASPIYHNSYSGLLKSALDHLAISLCAYKPFGLLSHGSGRNTQAVDHLRIVVRGLLGVAIPTQICTDDDDYRPTESGYELTSVDILARLDRFANEITAMAIAFRTLRA
jgi:NAD(P)H-dependent FMN reductase